MIKGSVFETGVKTAAISGQYETVKMLLESGEDVDQRDQVLVIIM